jgi:hypothetical protein
MKQLAAFEQLQTLHLDKVHVTVAGLKELAVLAHLQKLSFYDCRDLTDAHLKELAGMKQLKELNLISCFKVTDAGLKELTTLENLDQLSINDLNRVTPATVAELQKTLPRCRVWYPTKARKELP